MEDYSTSFVIPYGENVSNHCGYCKGLSTRNNVTWGMSAERLTVSHYQYLIDRGWRRSGTYCYKPSNNVTCCPPYAIRCDVMNFKLSRSQKRVLQAVASFLTKGQMPKWNRNTQMDLQCSRGDQELMVPMKSGKVVKSRPVAALSGETIRPSCTTSTRESKVFTPLNASPAPTAGGDVTSPPVTANKPSDSPSSCGDVPVTGPGLKGPLSTGQNPTTSAPKSSEKARARRWAAKLQRFERIAIQQKVTMDELKEAYFKRRQRRLDENKPKPLEYYLITGNQVEENKHFLEVRLVRSHPMSPELKESLTAAQKVYQRYQMAVHGDTKYECSMAQFRRFLVDSPLLVQPSTRAGDTAPLHGSYHQQYWLDGKQLIAVGVIDLLPACLSSVYFFYDPAYAFLHMGTYSALREVAFARQLIRTYGSHQTEPGSAGSPLYTEFAYYYMGYYIHTCPKMTYKAEFRPAYLACPVTHQWVPIAECYRLLSASPEGGRCARFSQVDTDPRGADPAEPSDDEIDAKLVCRVRGGRGRSGKAEADRLFRLNQLVSHLRPDGLTMLRNCCKLVGEPVLSGRLQVLLLGVCPTCVGACCCYNKGST